MLDVVSATIPATVMESRSFLGPGVRFIGSKERLLGFLEEKVMSTVSEDDVVFGDLFAGTAAVSKLFKARGKLVIASDNLRCCYVFAQAVLGNNKEPSFDNLFSRLSTKDLRNRGLFSTPYDSVLSHLNSLSGAEGFIYREYSPEGTAEAPHQRAYFTEDNARRIDAVRNQIFSWRREHYIDEAETCLLLSDLMRAANRVANISGTYGCFNKSWDKRAHKPLLLERLQIIPSNYSHTVFLEDALQVVKRQKFDVLYLDPPYTWRHYGAYYHMLETIAAGDEPTVIGITGLRPWEHSKSRFSDRLHASSALRDLIRDANARHIFLSYSSEGLISHDEIVDALRSRGSVSCWDTSHRRFRSNSGGSLARQVTERLYHVKTS